MGAETMALGTGREPYEFNGEQYSQRRNERGASHAKMRGPPKKKKTKNQKKTSMDESGGTKS